MKTSELVSQYKKQLKIFSLGTDAGVSKNLEFIFRQLVVERNKIAKKKGFKNYFEFMADWDGIPQKKLAYFLDHKEDFVNKILNLLQPKFIDNLNEYFNFYPQVNYKVKGEQELLNYLINGKKIDINLLGRIKLVVIGGYLYKTKFNYKKKSVIIECSQGANETLEGYLSLAHEFGHALFLLKLMDKGINPKQESNFINEKAAVKMELEYSRFLSKNVYTARIGNFLHTFTNTVFEHQIYTNPEYDFGVAYLESRRQVYKSFGAEISQNYLKNMFFVEYPCYSSIYSVIYSVFLGDNIINK